jgi:transposase
LEVLGQRGPRLERGPLVTWGIPTRDHSPSDDSASLARLIAEVAALRELIESESGLIAELTGAVGGQDARIAELEKLLKDSRRSGKRQAAPFSKGASTEEPKRPGRAVGKDHGKHGHRMALTRPVDRELDAPLPACCPDCGGDVVHERDEEQFHTELPDMAPVITRFTIGIGRCWNCKKRIQGRHPEQTSDALGAASSQIGPHAKGLATWQHYALWLSFAKAAPVLSLDRGARPLGRCARERRRPALISSPCSAPSWTASTVRRW